MFHHGKLLTEQHAMQLRQAVRPRPLSLLTRKLEEEEKQTARQERRAILLAGVNEARLRHGLPLLTRADRVNSHDGVCIRCGAEQVMNSENKFVCWFCRNDRHDLREREQAMLCKMDEERMPPYKSELAIKLDSTLCNVNPGMGNIRRNSTFRQPVSPAS